MNIEKIRQKCFKNINLNNTINYNTVFLTHNGHLT